MVAEIGCRGNGGLGEWGDGVLGSLCPLWLNSQSFKILTLVFQVMQGIQCFQRCDGRDFNFF